LIAAMGSKMASILATLPVHIYEIAHDYSEANVKEPQHNHNMKVKCSRSLLATLCKRDSVWLGEVSTSAYC